MIVHEHGKWVLKTKDGSKVLGTHPTKEAAEAQERAVEAHKHSDGIGLNVTRVDRGELRKATKRDNGWLDCEGFVGRAGLLTYRKADGTPWVEYRPPEEAFKADALASFSLVPLTNNHPGDQFLDAKNTRGLQVGTVAEAKQDGDRIRSPILVTDADTIADMEAGKVELSSGYTCDVEATAGEVGGQRYDAIQRNVRANHVALVNRGRAGPEVRVRMDSLDLVVVDSDSGTKEKGRQPMLKIHIDGIEVEVSETAAALIAKTEKAHADALTAAKTDAEKAQRESAANAARADAAEGKVAKLTADLAKAPAEAKVAAEARVKLEGQAREVLGSAAKLDGLSDIEVKRNVVESATGRKLDGKPDAYVDAAFDLALADFEPGALHQDDKPITARVDALGSDVQAAMDAFAKASREASAVKPRAAR